MDEQIQKQSIPWSQRKEIGFFIALWETIKMVLFKPAEFFTNLEIAGSYSEPVLFYIIVATFSGVIFLLQDILFKRGAYLFKIPAPAFVLIIAIALGVYLYLGSAITHLGVLLVGGKGGYRGTFNVVAYSAASASIFNVIPFVGNFIGAVWSVVIGVIGLKIIHRLGIARTIFAYFTFWILIFIISMLIVITFPHFKG